MTAAIRLTHGAKFPFDAPDAWWDGDASNPPPPTDWAHAAARGVVAELQGRAGIKHGFNDIDQEIRAEIVSRLADIIRVALEGRS